MIPRCETLKMLPQPHSRAKLIGYSPGKLDAGLGAGTVQKSTPNPNRNLHLSLVEYFVRGIRPVLPTSQSSPGNPGCKVKHLKPFPFKQRNRADKLTQGFIESKRIQAPIAKSALNSGTIAEKRHNKQNCLQTIMCLDAAV